VGLGLILCTMGAANSATYCAKYVGGQERVGSGARSQCEFTTLKARVAPVSEKGAAELATRRGNYVKLVGRD